MDYAQQEIDRLTEIARHAQNAAWYGPEFYGYTPATCEHANRQCLSFCLVYAEQTGPALRRSLEEALVQHGCRLATEAPATVDGVLACSAVSQQGARAIKKVRALLRRWSDQGRITSIDAHERVPKPKSRARKRTPGSVG